MSALTDFERARPRLFGIAYRMTGSVMEAEELVQESYLRWRRAPVDEIESPAGYLVRIVTRLALDRLKSASARREQYIGPWLPEPLRTGPGAPDHHLERREAISTAFLLLLQRLNGVERAVYVLRELFDYDYATIAGIVDRNEATCRQIARRARARVAAGQPRYEPDRAQREALTARFFESCATGDMEGLLSLLADEVVAYSDGGGRPGAARKPVAGAHAVARFLLGILKLVPEGVSPEFCQLNGDPALLVRLDGAPYAALTLAFEGERIVGIYNLLNPEKLRPLA